MATETKIETKTVEEEVEVKVCDYCMLVTEEDIEDDEEFHEILLNPFFREKDNIFYENVFKPEVRQIYNIFQENVQDNEVPELEEFNREVYDVLFHLVQRFVDQANESTADLCPGCVSDLFGDGPATGIRSGTGYIKEE